MENRTFILDLLKKYEPEDSSEELSRKEVIEFVRENERCFENDFEPGHITGSALVTDSEMESVLLTHHSKLDKWIQFGGHSDGHWNALEVAWREASEESGLSTLAYIPGKEGIFDIDIHPIPALGKMPEHNHYDVRILLTADKTEPYTVTHESRDLKWIKLEDVSQYNTQKPFLRMIDKVKSLRLE